jgi:hypothetical protein
MSERGKRVREVEIEVERVRVVSNLRKSKTNCESCLSETDFITLANALMIFETTEPVIAQLAGRKVLHLKAGVGNELLICLRSLLSARDFF